MKIRTTFIGAALCAMVAACSSAPDTTERAEAIQKKADEIGKVTAPLYMQLEAVPGGVEVDVTTCPTLHDQTQHGGPLTCVGTGDLQQVLITVRDARDRIVQVIVEDRPGGGCIHVDMTGISQGFKVAVLAIVKGAPDTHLYSVGRISEVVPAL